LLILTQLVEVLRTALKDEDLDVRRGLKSKLGRIGDCRAVRALRGQKW